VGDTTGPGGIVRALRTVPMFQVIAEAIRDHCPDAWVINYTNPMTVCIRTLYKTFPGIKAFGCCHEVFGTQNLLASAYADQFGGEAPFRREIKVNVIGVNHFTWVTSAQYRNVDLFPVYAEMAQKYAETGYTKGKDDNWMNNTFDYNQRVKFDLFNRYGCIAAAGDRHLAEFCPGKWYLESPEQVKAWGFGLTTVRWRKNDLANRRQKTADILSGKEKVVLRRTGEEGVSQMRALLGLHTMITNVNMPNKGQIPNLPLGAVVETNAVFSSNHVTPCMAGPVPMTIYGLIAPIVAEQENLVEAAFRRDLEGVFAAFVNDPLVTINMTDARTLFDQMIDNTKAYLSEYFR
jgi:alpha-galactosidase